MTKIIKKEPNKEIFEIKLKDKPDRQGKTFKKFDGSNFVLSEITVTKFHGENNKIRVELIYAE